MPPDEVFERGSDGLYDFMMNPANPNAVSPPIIDGDALQVAGAGLYDPMAIRMQDRMANPPGVYVTAENPAEQDDSPPEVLNFSTDPDDNVTFLNNSIEIMKIDDQGVHVHGHLAVEDKEIYHAFLEWLNIGRMDNGLPPVKPKIPYEKPTFTRYDAIKGAS
jgi:hypothetical protein